MDQDVLYLGSKSQGRRQLLEDGRIPFKLLVHASSEQEIPFDGELGRYVCDIALAKLASLALPGRDEVGSDRLFVLTADTLVQHPQTGEVFGKPEDRVDAGRMLAAEFDCSVRVESGHCLTRFTWDGRVWRQETQLLWSSGAGVVFSVPADEVDLFLRNAPIAMYACGSAIIEGFGNNYFKSINGSYSAVKGLDLPQVRQKLKQLGFRF